MNYILLISTITPLLLFYLRNKIKDVQFRRRRTVDIMGLTRSFIQSHSVIKISSFSNFEDFLTSLEKSARQSLSNQVIRTFETNKIVCRTISHDQLTFRHFLIILGHQRRKSSFFRAFRIALFRYLAISIMWGCIDEYWLPTTTTDNKQIFPGDYELVAFSHSIVKGKALRGMWFYQIGKASRCMIWYHTVRTAIQRGILMHLELIDIGPSYDSNIRNSKEKVAFQPSFDWRSSYSGELQDLPNSLSFKCGIKPFL